MKEESDIEERSIDKRTIIGDKPNSVYIKSALYCLSEVGETELIALSLKSEKLIDIIDRLEELGFTVENIQKSRNDRGKIEFRAKVIDDEFVDMK